MSNTSTEPHFRQGNMELTSDFERPLGSENLHTVDIDLDFLDEVVDNPDDDYILDDVPVEAESGGPGRDDEMYDEERPAQPMEEDIELKDEELEDVEEPTHIQDGHEPDDIAIDFALSPEKDPAERQSPEGTAAGPQDTRINAPIPEAGSVANVDGYAPSEPLEPELDHRRADQALHSSNADADTPADDPPHVTVVDQEGTLPEDDAVVGHITTPKSNGVYPEDPLKETPEQAESGHAGQNAEYQKDLDRIHPVIVLYAEKEMSLFPPYSDDPTDTYFLSDVSLVNASISELFKAMRVVLAESIGEDDQLEFDIDGLDLYMNEHSSCVNTVRFADVLDLHVSLHLNDGIDNPEPLYLRVTVRQDPSTRMHDLTEAVTTGKGISQLFIEEDQVGDPAEDEPREDEEDPQESSMQGDDVREEELHHYTEPDNSSKDTYYKHEPVNQSVQGAFPSVTSASSGQRRRHSPGDLTSSPVTRSNLVSKQDTATIAPSATADSRTDVTKTAAVQGEEAEEYLIDYGEDENGDAASSNPGDLEYQIDCGIEGHDDVAIESAVPFTSEYHSHNDRLPNTRTSLQSTEVVDDGTEVVSNIQPDALAVNDGAASVDSPSHLYDFPDNFDEELVDENQSIEEPPAEETEVGAPVEPEVYFEEDPSVMSQANLRGSQGSYDQPHVENQDEENETFTIDTAEYHEEDNWTNEGPGRADRPHQDNPSDAGTTPEQLAVQQTHEVEDDGFNSDLDFEGEIIKDDAELQETLGNRVQKTAPHDARDTNLVDSILEPNGKAHISDADYNQTTSITYETDEEEAPSLKGSDPVNGTNSPQGAQSQITTTKRLRGANDEKDLDQDNQESKRMKSM